MARKKNIEKTAEASLAHAIRLCVDTGKVEFGTKTGIKKTLLGRAKLLIIGGNCPKETYEDAVRFCKLSSIPFIKYDGTSIELGTIAGRPHPVAILTVLDEGNSGILQFAKQYTV